MFPNIEQELKDIASESIGWLPLEERAYLHVSSEDKDDSVIITGQPDVVMDGDNVLLLL